MDACMHGCMDVCVHTWIDGWMNFHVWSKTKAEGEKIDRAGFEQGERRARQKVNVSVPRSCSQAWKSFRLNLSQ